MKNQQMYKNTNSNTAIIINKTIFWQITDSLCSCQVSLSKLLMSVVLCVELENKNKQIQLQ